MSTDFQRAREALGARLRQLRVDAGLSGRALAALAGWPHSKISKLETGRQTAVEADLTAWAEHTGNLGMAASLHADLRGLETQYRSWRRRLAAGHEAAQREAGAEERAARMVRAYEPTVIPGILQTPDYARAVLTAAAVLHQSPRDTEDAVRERVRRQELLYERGRSFHFILWEGVLHAQPCPREVLAAQLDRLTGLVGLDTVTLGVIPFSAALPLTLRHGFWIHDEAYVTVETINAALWLDTRADVDLYLRAWSMYEQVAEFGAGVHRLIGRARHALAAL
ncbi:helix-turn-helix domain-containing protein [Kitasatospora sp. NBC_01287]|uniref:helix-turn-helix domain-containing protein n=1 Tax=Kitasatospora sp. NBC_01287 TaxID=2903573 RepID=UPI00225604B0|nr:helix-turn-helix transcriptional regulator [Kitasatospora sp. NBC_01287]MCX4749804.1 helix-turn-helix domain-containing protein [Kitasatospora sp. NBC_01287]